MTEAGRLPSQVDLLQMRPSKVIGVRVDQLLRLYAERDAAIRQSIREDGAEDAGQRVETT